MSSSLDDQNSFVEGSFSAQSMTASYDNTNIKNNNNKLNKLTFQPKSSFEDPYTYPTTGNFFSSLFNNLVENSNTTNNSNNNSEYNRNPSSSPLTSPVSSPFSLPFKSPFSTSPTPKTQSPTVYDLSYILKSLSLSCLISPLSNEMMNKREELLTHVLLLLYAVVWRCDDDAVVEEDGWKTRIQTFLSLTTFDFNNQNLLFEPLEALRRFFEILILATYNDMNQLPISSRSNVAKNAVRLLKHLYYFLTCNQAPLLYSEQLLDRSMDLMTSVSLLGGNDNKTTLQQLQLAIVLLFINQADLTSQAVIHLHEILHNNTTSNDNNNNDDNNNKTFFILAQLNQAFNQTGSVEWAEMTTPLMGTLLSKNTHLTSPHLPHLPSPSNFFNNFRSFQKSQEWRDFIEKQVTTAYLKYKATHLDKVISEVKGQLDEGLDDLVVVNHRTNRHKQESIIKFEKQYISCMKAREAEELSRQRGLKARIKAESNCNDIAWKQAKRNLSMGNNDKTTIPPQLGPLAISARENDLRMRPKLVNGEVRANLYNLKSPLMAHGGDHQNAVSELKSLEVDKLKVVSGVMEEQLDEDDWIVINDNNLPSPTSADQKEFGSVLSAECELVTLCEKIKGRLDITAFTIIFTNTSIKTPSPTTTPAITTLKIPLDQLHEIHFRRHNLRWSALEIFLVNQTNHFFNFDKTTRNKVYTRLIRLHPPNLINFQSRSPSQLIKASGITQKWVKREMSNFEYLMRVNTISGRTYNDLSQYPVFPWILSDYTSETLDLNDPKVYRDLRWPMGAANPKNRSFIKEKYESLLESSGEASDLFHYGTHYSNPAGVMHYLLRLEPFTSLHVQLQDGSFDLSDRQFHSIASTWESLITNPNDVKELIPEFFYLPEFLVNHNELELGEMQGGKGSRFGDVILPPWAHNPQHFIHKHMQALESDHVSNNLHHWIDLIFGFKQQGLPAIEALNVFYYCTYEGAVDLDAVTDVKRREALEGIITNFGQAPSQLFKEPHPKRMSMDEWRGFVAKIDRPLNVYDCLDKIKESTIIPSPPHHPPIFISTLSSSPLLVSSLLQPWSQDTLVCITTSGLLGLHTCLLFDKTTPSHFTFNQDPSIFNPKLQKRLYTTSKCQLMHPLTPQLFAITPDGRLLISGGYWDNSLRVLNVAKMKQVAHIVSHNDVITCLRMERLGRRLVTGSRDFTCIVWELLYKGSKSDTINPTPLRILHTHTSEITSVDLSWHLDLLISASKDGVVMVYDLEEGNPQRTLKPPHAKGWMVVVERVVLSDMGFVCVYCSHTFSVVGGSSCSSSWDGGGGGGSSWDGGSGGSISGDIGDSIKGGVGGLGGGSEAETSMELQATQNLHQDKLSLHLYSINGKHLSREELSCHVTEMVTCGVFLLVGFKTGEFCVKRIHSFETVYKHTFNAPVNCVTVCRDQDHILVGLNDSTLSVLSVDRSLL